VFSVLQGPGGLESTEVGAARTQRLQEWLARMEAPSAWKAPNSRRWKLRRGRAFRRLLEGCQLWLARAELTGEREDYERAFALAAQASESAAGNERLVLHALSARTAVTASRAAGLADLVAAELASVEARRGLEAARALIERDESSYAYDLALKAALVETRVVVFMAEQVVSARTVKLAGERLESTAALVEAFDVDPHSRAAIELELMRSMVGELVEETGGRAGLDAAVEASRGALELAHAAGDPEMLARSGTVLARQLWDRSSNFSEDAAEDLRQTLSRALVNSMPGSLACLDLIAKWSEVIYHAGVEGGRDDLLSFAEVGWRISCEHLLVRLPARCLTVSEQWARYEEQHRGPVGALPAYELALSALRALTRAHAYHGHRGVWLAKGRRVHAMSSSAMASAGRLRSAVEVAEAGRSVMLQPILGADFSQLDELGSLGRADLAEHYRRAAFDVQEAAAAASVLSGPVVSIGDEERERLMQALGRTAERMRAAEATIRMQPGFEDFPARDSYERIRAIADDAPLVYLVPGATAGNLLVIRSPDSEPDEIELPRLSFPDALSNAVDYLVAYRGWDPEAQEQGDWPDRLLTISAWLWETVMQTLLEALDGVSFARLVPMGPLAVLPLHLACADPSHGAEYALDRLAIGYLPSAALLRAARQRPVSAAWSPLLVTGAGVASDDTAAELAAAASAFSTPSRSLGPEESTPGLVIAELEERNFAHIAAHGRVNEELPFESGIDLAGNERLTVDGLRQRDLRHLEMLVLSSCESAVPGSLALDESISIPGMLFGTSARTIIATQWAVYAEASSVVMREFYARWGCSRDPAAIACALRDAQVAARERGSSDHPAWWGGFIAMV
jgi:hypothetical protein